ncbi:hypothetical protein D9M73_165440 [compost metagenome]
MGNDRQRAAAQLAAHQGVDRQALDLLVVDEVVVVLSGPLGQARDLDQLFDLGGTGFLLGFLLLLAVELLIALDLLGHGFLRRALLGVIQLDLAFVGQSLLFLLVFADLLGLLLVDQPCFEQLVAKGNAHGAYYSLGPRLNRSWANSFPDVWLRPTRRPTLRGCNLPWDGGCRAMPVR